LFSRWVSTEAAEATNTTTSSTLLLMAERNEAAETATPLFHSSLLDSLKTRAVVRRPNWGATVKSEVASRSRRSELPVVINSNERTSTAQLDPAGKSQLSSKLKFDPKYLLPVAVPIALAHVASNGPGSVR
jgi:hypothetical protein